MLHLEAVEREGRDVVARQEIKGNCLILKTLRPNFCDLAHAGVDICHLVLHFEAVDLQGCVGQQVLNEVAKPMPLACISDKTSICRSVKGPNFCVSSR